MAEIIAFGVSPDLDVMDRQALTAYLAEIRRRIAALDEREPENMSSEAYDEWSEENMHTRVVPFAMRSCARRR